MPRKPLYALVVLLLVALAGCSGRHSPSGFRLPPGDVAGGEKAFVDLQCSTCHTLPGADLPAPTTDSPVALGGRVVLPPTDGDLTTDIILPASHFASGYPASQVQEGSKSKMPDYTEKVTIKQLADLVAFLQSKYTVVVSTK
jgi:mono/diheme cytochrome c family protein